MRINIIQYLEQTIKLYPQKIAVCNGDRSIKFNDLGCRSKIIAKIIREKIKTVNNPIAVLLPKSIDSVVANFGITYSGNAYMNLDVKAPDERINSILEHITPILIITNTLNYKRIKNFYNEENIINIDSLNFDVKNEDFVEYWLNSIIDQDPYCLINTSGSTGIPKSVILNHKSFIDFIEWSFDTFNFNESTKIGSLSPSIFDIYSYEICLLASKGATLYIVPEEFTSFPVKIVDYIQEKNITFIFWVPTIMVNIANYDLLKNKNLNLNLIWFAGEVFPTKQFNYWKNYLPTSTFVNMYGPIEITLDCTYYEIKRSLDNEEPIPIGRPCKNTDVLILDENNELINSQNIDGELCVRGTSLAMGYYKNPEMTKKSFVQNPLNKSYPELIYRTGDIVYVNNFGEIVYKGRKDTLIKHLGYRIELGEIEHVCINILKLVKNCCALYNHEEKKIILAYEAECPIEDIDLRNRLKRVLPKYMVPHIFIHKKQLPLNPNGKIDRLKIKEDLES